MGAGHGHRLHFHGHSPVHRAPAHLKVLALLGFMLVVVATPRQAYPACPNPAALTVAYDRATRDSSASRSTRSRFFR